ncbi:MAG: hypothetical protein JRJ24_21420 [Deltaproteobacteria bacterium]|nr:hypothetical protein [Deltaproteobacteria bacterium]
MRRLLPLALLTACFAAHAAAFDNPRQGQGYLHSSWSTVHTDSSNSDHVPLAMTANVSQRWHLLKGAGIWTPPVVAIDGTVYAVTGEGPGHSLAIRSAAVAGRLGLASGLQCAGAG